MASAAKPDPVDLGDRVFDALGNNHYGQLDGLIEAMTPALGAQGLDHLKARVLEYAEAPQPAPAAEERRVIGWSSSGAIYADDVARTRRDSTVRLALQQIVEGPTVLRRRRTRRGREAV